jgi:hypothetical protein
MRKLILIMLILSLVLVSYTASFAATPITVDKPASTGKVICVDSNPTKIYFDQNGKQISNPNGTGNIIANATGPVKLLETKTADMIWIGYLSYPDFWGKADHYKLNKGETYTANGSYKWKDLTVGLTFSQTKSVEVSFPADPLRWSRLGTYADITLKKYQTTSPKTIYTEVTYRNKYVTTVYK